VRPIHELLEEINYSLISVMIELQESGKMNISSILGIVTLLIATLSYSIYFRDIRHGRTNPHGVSWLIWSALNIFIFLQQTTHGAGAGAWITGATAIANLAVFIVSLRYGDRSVRRLDYVCLVLAAVTLGIWLFTDNAAISVILASGTFVLGFVPTFYKSFKKPREETIVTFELNSLKFLIAIFALEAMNITTVFYPAALFAVNAMFVGFLLYRRSRMIIKEERGTS
jgi:hypothetical protein